LFSFYKKKGSRIQPGLLFGIFLSGVFGFRIFVEQFKENQSSFEEGMMLNMGQILSIPLVLLGLYLIYRALTGTNRQTPPND
jgi:prolipoprotein diacylglyceryltransferase